MMTVSPFLFSLLVIVSLGLWRTAGRASFMVTVRRLASRLGRLSGDWIWRAAGVSSLALLPTMAHAITLSGLLQNLGQTGRDILNFIVICSLVGGVLAILNGCKLIWDKANERENVKNSHIVWSFVGGTFGCILWFVVSMLAETAGGTVGESASF